MQTVVTPVFSCFLLTSDLRMVNASKYNSRLSKSERVEVNALS